MGVLGRSWWSIRWCCFVLKVQVSQDPILIHSTGSSLGNCINGLGYGVTKSFTFQGLEESATAFKVNPTNMIARGNKKEKMPYTELLKAKTPADIESIRIPSATRGQNNTNVYFTSYAPVPPFMLNKIVEYNSSTSKSIAVYCVKALKTSEPTQAAIATLTYVPSTTYPEYQEEKSGE